MHQQARILAASYREAFESEAGRRVLADLQARAFHRESSFSPDPQRAAFNEGRRSLLLHVLRMLYQDAPEDPGQGRFGLGA